MPDELPDALFMGGPVSGLELKVLDDDSRPFPPEVQISPILSRDFLCLTVTLPVWVCGGDPCNSLRVIPHYKDTGWEDRVYRLSKYTTAGGLKIYQWYSKAELFPHVDGITKPYDPFDRFDDDGEPLPRSSAG
jgi:hypothetical protein